MQPYSSTNMVTTWNNLFFIMLERSDFCMVALLSIYIVTEVYEIVW